MRGDVTPRSTGPYPLGSMVFSEESPDESASPSHFESARGAWWNILPEMFPWEQDLPRVPLRVRQSPVLRPEGADRVPGRISARGVDASTSRDAGTSATVRIRSASGRSSAGRRHAAKPDIDSTPTPKPGTPNPTKASHRAGGSNWTAG
jgi:hypothetical protein